MVKEFAIGLLFSAGDAGAIYVDPSLDITAEVIKRFDTAMAVKAGGVREARLRRQRRSLRRRGACAVNAEARSTTGGAACRSAGDTEANATRACARKTVAPDRADGRGKRAEAYVLPSALIPLPCQILSFEYSDPTVSYRPLCTPRPSLLSPPVAAGRWRR